MVSAVCGWHGRSVVLPVRLKIPLNNIEVPDYSYSVAAWFPYMDPLRVDLAGLDGDARSHRTGPTAGGQGVVVGATASTSTRAFPSAKDSGAIRSCRRDGGERRREVGDDAPGLHVRKLTRDRDA